jgi:kynurenine formamidase
MTRAIVERVVDLSREISPETPMFRAYPAPAFVPWTTRAAHGFLAEALFLVTHTGTHVDAPWHCLPDGRTIERFPPSRFVVPARLLDLRFVRPRARIGEAVLRRALKGFPFPRGDAAVLWTGWERKAGRPSYLLDNPGLTPDGARALHRWGAPLVGIDTANLDHPDAARLEAHEILLRDEVFVLENLANLGAIRAERFLLVALPLPLRGATGSPVRAVALVNPSTRVDGAERSREEGFRRRRRRTP